MSALSNIASPHLLAGLRPDADTPVKSITVDDARLKAREQAEEFEAVFLHTFVEQMFQGIKTDGPFTGGSSEEIYRSMMSKEYATSITRSGGIGLADHVYAEILKAQQIEP